MDSPFDQSARAEEVTAVPFPLPFTPFEYYYWCDDRPASPTTFPIELVFRGTLNRSEFEQAFRSIVARHPLLQALVDAHSTRIPRWVDAGSQIATIDWADVSEPMRPSVVGFLDLTSRPGLRIWVRTSPGQSRVVLQFHHACCDALGALQFVEELLVGYDSLIRGMEPDARLPTLDSSRLSQRGDYGLSETGYRPGLWDAFMTARIWASTLLSRPSLVAASSRMSRNLSSTADDEPYFTESLSHDDMQHLHAVARQAGATVNDLMLRELMLALQQWNAEHNGRRRQRLTVNVPVSLRSRADHGMPAANSLGFWFIHRTATDRTRPETLLDSIREETAAVKKWRLPLYFVGGLGIAARIPGLMRGMLSHKRSFATAVFSNVGRVFARTPLERRDGRLVCGNVVLERVTGVPPIRPGTRIAIVVVAYGNETTLNLRSDPSSIPPSDARQLLTRFREQLLISASV